MALDRAAAFTTDRTHILALLHDLSEEEWAAPSKCAGWQEAGERHRGRDGERVGHRRGIGRYVRSLGHAREPWREAGVAIKGDEEVGTHFLDSLRII